MSIWALFFAICAMGLFSWQSMGICRRLKNQQRVAVANVAFWLSMTVVYTAVLINKAVAG